FEISSTTIELKNVDRSQEIIEHGAKGNGEDDAVSFDLKMKENVRHLQESAKRKAQEINDQDKKLSKTLVKIWNMFGDAIRKEIEQVKQDIKKLDHSKDSEVEDGPAKKKVKESFVETQRKKYLSSGRALAAKRKKGNEAETLEKLKSFQSKLMVAEPTEDAPIPTNEDAEPCILHSIL
ncbi:12554_t:CDS:2, partial [Acaulospora colombiana]